MSKINRAKGIIIRKSNLRENDLIISVLTNENGREDFVIKSVKKPTAKNSSKMDLLNEISFCYASGKSLKVITEVKVINDNQKLKHDKNVNPYLLLALEIIEKVSFQYHEIDIYELTSEILKRFDSEKEIHLLVIFLIMKIIEISGFQIDFANYIDTTESISPKEKFFVNHDLGFSEKTSPYSLSQIEFKILRYIYQSNLNNLKKINLKTLDLSNILKVSLYWIESMLNKELVSKKIIF